MLVYCLHSGGVPRDFVFLPSPDEAPPSRLGGCGQGEEVELRGGVCRLRGEKACSCFEASGKRRN